MLIIRASPLTRGKRSWLPGRRRRGAWDSGFGDRGPGIGDRVVGLRWAAVASFKSGPFKMTSGTSRLQTLP